MTVFPEIWFWFFLFEENNELKIIKSWFFYSMYDFLESDTFVKYVRYSPGFILMI